jgi:16S rRNA (guanine(966)-N(2))-methyltransferase RsmD
LKAVRPTSGKVLLALFSILGDLNGKAFLDLFSGTGRVSRSARDRGASPVVSVEILPQRVKEIRSLFARNDGVTILTMDVRRAVSFLRRKGQFFDVIFADPPYAAGWSSVLGTIIFPSEGGILAAGGIAVVEHSTREEMAEGENWRIIDRREYGDTALTFLSSSGRGGEV